MNINVEVETIEDFEKNIINKKERVEILLEQMIRETEDIKPFFNTSAGLMINESLRELLYKKKTSILDMNDEFLANLKSAEGIYTAAFEKMKSEVGN